MIAESFFQDIPNGLARVAWDVSRQLVRRGHEVDLVCPSGEVQNELQTCELDGVQVSRYPRPRAASLNPANPWKHVAGYRDAIQTLSKERTWNVVHCHGIYAIAGAVAALPDVPRVLTVHSPAFLEQAWNWTHGRMIDWVKLPGLIQIKYFEKRAVKSAVICHSLSEFTRMSMERLYPTAMPRPWRVIPHWADASWGRQCTQEQARRLLGWPVETPVVLAVRQLKPRYGLDIAIRGLAPLIRVGRCIFRICGDGPERRRLHRLASSLGLDQGVVFEGRVSDDMLRLCYQATDICVIPSIALECFGLIVLEAYAAGVPVVATSNGALPETVAPVSPGLLVPPRGSRRLGEVMTGLLDGVIPRPAPKRLQAYVATAYSSDRIVTHYERMYHEALNAN